MGWLQILYAKLSPRLSFIPFRTTIKNMKKIKEIRACFLCKALNVKQIQKGKKIFFQCPSCKKMSARFYEISSATKARNTKFGITHYSAGALIEKNGKYLVSKRTFYPYLYTLVGGHVDKGETMEKALAREIKEETGLNVKDKKLIFKGIINPDPCTRGVDIHYWNLFLVHAKGILKMNAFESVHLRWLTKRQMARLRFTPPITYIFKKLKFFLDINVFF